MSAVKVWCEKRERKKCIVVAGSLDLDEFIEKVKARFELAGTLRIVLEEDGTEVEDSLSLEAFKDKILLVLENGALWTRSQASDSSDSFLSPPPVNQQPATPRTPLRSCNSQDSIPRRPDETPRSKKKAWSNDFKIPWNKLPTQLLNKLERSENRETEPEMKLTKTELNEVIRTVVQEIRAVDEYPGIRAIRKIAERMVTKFMVLADLDEKGKFIGSGHGSLSIKLQDHNNYLNRPSNNSSLLSMASSPAGPDGRRKRKADKKTAQCGTSEWQPEYPLNESRQSQTEKQQWLILESKKSKKDRDSDKINEYMEITYPSQRLQLNTDSTCVADIKNDWPLLLEQSYLEKHCERLIDNFEAGLDYWAEEKLKKIIHLVEERITVEKARAITEKNEEVRKEKMTLADQGVKLVNSAKKSPVVGAVNLVLHKFNERKKGSKLLFVELDEGATRDEILAAPRSPTPCIVIAGRNMFEGSIHYVVAENTIISAHVKAAEALTAVYCLHFVFNMRYPAHLGHSWDFIQRFIFENNPKPEQGSKNPKRKCVDNLAGPVVTLMRELSRFTLPGEPEEDVHNIDDD